MYLCTLIGGGKTVVVQSKIYEGGVGWDGTLSPCVVWSHSLVN